MSSALPALAPRPANLSPSAETPLQPSREHSEAEWETMKPLVRHLYVDEGRTLKQTMAMMRRRHGFAASEQMYKKRFKKWDFRKQAYNRRAHGSGSGSASLSLVPPSEAPEPQTVAAEAEESQPDETMPGDSSLSLVRLSKLDEFAGLELLLSSSSSWCRSKLDAGLAGSDPMSRYLANPTKPLIQDSRTMYRTFELVFDLWHRGRGDLAGMAARRGFYALEFVLTEDHPDLVWHVLDTIYDMIDRGHLQLLCMFIPHAHELASRLLPANHPLVVILRQLRKWDYQSEEERRHICHLLKQAWLRNVDLLGQRIGSLAPRHLWLYEQLIWDGRTRLRRDSQLAQRREAMVAALEKLAQARCFGTDEDGPTRLRIEALGLEFTQMDLKDKQRAEQLAVNLLSRTESHPDTRANDRFHAYAHKMLARIQEERHDFVNAEENLRQAVTKREAAHGGSNDLRVIRDMWVLAEHYQRVGRPEDASRTTRDALERARQYLDCVPDQERM